LPRNRGPRRILGNLDAEADLALVPTRWRHRPAGRRITLSRAALQTLSGAATLLRVFAREGGREGDHLWTPVPVDPGRLAQVPGLPVPTLESGPLDALLPAAAVLAWAETPQVVAHRGPAPVGMRRPEDRFPLWELFWHLRPASPEVVATVHHRAFALEVAQRLGRELPGARIVESLPELDAHLAERPPGPWVVKAALSAAGRARHVEHSLATELSPEVRVRVARLLSVHGSLLFEPWMERVDDLGSAVLLLPEEVWTAGYHRQIVDAEGRFRGIELSVDRLGPPHPDLLLAATIVRVGDLLEQEGYRGPFGIDAFVHRLPRGALALHPLGEINARMTFGLVARALVDRLREPLGLDPEAQVRLLFGPQLPETGGVVPLLLPGRGKAEGAAWLEIPA
jgi:hypothetical protein